MCVLLVLPNHSCSPRSFSFPNCIWERRWEKLSFENVEISK